MQKAEVYLDDERGRILYFPKAFPEVILGELDQGIDWQQDFIKIYGRTLPLPRLTAWYGDAEASYRYSGIVNIPKPWTPLLLNLKSRSEELSGARFNSVLLNRYETGDQYQGYHADDEPELGDQPCIASLSFGACRKFRFKEKKGDLRLGIDLEAGSLLIMAGALQKHFVHALPKTQRPKDLRINLTYRWVFSLKT